jgi:hypothetical protein
VARPRQLRSKRSSPVRRRTKLTSPFWRTRTRVQRCPSNRGNPSNLVLNTSPRSRDRCPTPPRPAQAPCQASRRPGRAIDPGRGRSTGTSGSEVAGIHGFWPTANPGETTFAPSGSSLHTGSVHRDPGR